MLSRDKKKKFVRPRRVPLWILAWAILLALPAESQAKQPLDLWLGIDSGAGILNTSVDGEANKSGFSGGVKLLGNYSLGNPILGLAVGSSFTTVSGTRVNGPRLSTETLSVYGEVDVNFPLGGRFRAGPILTAQFGDDLSYKPDLAPILASESPRSFVLMGGAQVFYETKSETPLRFGARFQTDFNILNRQLYMVQAFLQIRLGSLFNSGPQRAEKWQISQNQKYRGVANEDLIASDTPFLDVPLYSVMFAVDSDRPTRKARAFLRKLGAILAENPELYTAVQVDGHTDKPGSYQYNLDLSGRRAIAIAKILKKAGVQGRMIRMRRFGESEPKVASFGSNRKNRRVSIRLYSVQSIAKLRQAMKSLLNKVES